MNITTSALPPLLVILDLDETLVHATYKPVNDHWDFEIGKYKVYKRPGLDLFLSNLGKHFKVAVWSSASDEYVKKVVEKIFPADLELLFVWGRSKCTLKRKYQDPDDGPADMYDHLQYVKVLRKVHKKGFGTRERMIIIDDTPRKSMYNYGNAIYPKEFNGEQDDRELELLFAYLLTLNEVENVRHIEKRHWRTSISNKP